jgi:hypothetical protein
MWPAFRVRPPAFEHSPELNWVLSRAFATISNPTTVDGFSALALSERLDVAARIAARHERDLAQELGPDAARQLAFRRLETFAIERVLGRLSDEVKEVAAARGISLILIKHAALRRAGLVQAGTRFARDLDVLVPRAQAQELQSALVERGFRGGPSATALHLPTLTRGPGEAVEIHVLLWGLAVAGMPAANGLTAEALISGGLTTSMSDGVQVPVRKVLATHAVVHGLVQHRTSPDGYPPMRAIADLVDIGVSGSAAESACCELLWRSRHRALLCAALRLAQSLKEGPVCELAPQSDERQLLSHLLAASGNDSYRSALRFERIFEPRELNGIWRTIGGAFRPQQPHGPTATHANRTTISALIAQSANYLKAQLRRRDR